MDTDEARVNIFQTLYTSLADLLFVVDYRPRQLTLVATKTTSASDRLCVQSTISKMNYLESAKIKTKFWIEIANGSSDEYRHLKYHKFINHFQYFV